MLRQQGLVLRRAGVVSTHSGQSLEEDYDQESQQRPVSVPRLLRRRQGVQTAAVLHLEHHRGDG